MRKALTLLAVLALGISVGINTVKVKASGETTGIIYYDVEKITATDVKNMPQGKYFMSLNGDLTDKDYMSAKFPNNLEANIEITGALDTADGYYGKDRGSTPSPLYGIDGYPVNVIKRDSLFDSCNKGHLFAPETIKDAKGEQQWIYYCNAGGAQNIGPYYLYSVKSVTYTVKDVSVKVLKSFADVKEETTITKDDFEVTIHATIDGKTVDYKTTDFKIDEYNNTVDPVNGPTSVKIKLEGEKEYTSLDIDVEVLSLQKETPAPTPTPAPIKKVSAPKSPETSFIMPITGIAGISLAAIGTCGILGKKRNK